MQRTVTALIVFTFCFSGCCRTGPWSLVSKDQPARTLDKGEYDYLVDQEDMKRNLERIDELKEQKLKEALAANEAESPNILSKIEPIDPETLTQQIQADRAKSSKPELASETIRLTAQKQSEPSPIQQASFETNVQAEEDSSLATATSSPVLLKPSFQSEPSPKLVSQPLKPMESLAPKMETASSPLSPMEEESDLDLELEIKDLPPMITAPPETPERFVNPAGLRPIPENQIAESIEWEQETVDTQIGLVSYEQEEEVEVSSNSEQEKEETAAASKDIAAATVETVGELADNQTTEEQPVEDFSADDFFPTGRCQQVACEEGCSCEGAEKANDGKVTTIAITKPKSFRPTLEMPGYGTFKPLRREDQVAVAEELDLPKTQKKFAPAKKLSGTPQNATPLPATPLPGFAEKSTSDSGAFRLPVTEVEPTFVVPASAVEEMDRLVDEVENTSVEMELPRQPLTWKEHLNKTISCLQEKLAITENPVQQKQLESKLQVLQLLPSELDQQQQEYMVALTDLLHTTADESSHDLFTTGKTLDELRQADTYLESLAAMKVVNASFCTKVTGFGQFDPTQANEFAAGQTTLVYCEIQNHSSQVRQIEGEAHHSTRLVASFIVYDENNQVVHQDSFPEVEDLARQRRNDFYMHLPFQIGDWPKGKYTYQLMIDDIGGNKSASLENTLHFEVK